MDKSLNEYTLKELQAFPNQEYDGSYITDIIIVPTQARHASKYRCMKYILLSNYTSKVCGVLGGYSDIIQLQRISDRDTYRIDCLYRSRCMRIMFSPQIKLKPFNVSFTSEFHIGDILW